MCGPIKTKPSTTSRTFGRALLGDEELEQALRLQQLLCLLPHRAVTQGRIHFRQHVRGCASRVVLDGEARTLDAVSAWRGA